MLFNNIILIYSLLLPKYNNFNNFNNINNINNKNAKKINNIKMSSENLNNTFNLYMQHELNSTDNINDFPSFYKFMRERELNELKAKEEYLVKRKNKVLNKINKTNKTINDEHYEMIEPTSKDLKLLSSLSTGEWMRTWLYEMVHVPDYFPTFMYHDMFRMREFSQKNNSKNYFFIGYFPNDINLKQGPFYIGAFELVPRIREFKTFIIIQNPYYCAENTYDENKIKNFKKELLALCNDSSVFFKFNNLKNNNDQRYYYSWFYEE